MAYDIGPTIGIEGEKEYRAALQNINTRLRTLGTEMQAVTSQFDKNDNSQQAVTAKSKVLTNQIGLQREKLQELQKGLTAATDKYGENHQVTQKWQQSVNTATAELNKMERELDQSGKKAKDSGDDAEKGRKGWDKLRDGMAAVGKAAATSIAALGTVAAGAATALAGLTVSASNYADELLTQATNTHHSAEQLQEYQYALRFVDGDIETLTKSMAKQIKSQDAARTGSKLVADAYKQLGIDVTNADGSLRDSNEVYWEVIDALHDIDNEYDRDALAMRIMGKSAQDLNTIIEAGGEEFTKYMREAKEMGIVMSEDAVKALGAFNDKVQVLDANMDGLKNTASLVALPFLDVLATDGIRIMSEFSKGIQDADGDIGKMGDAIGATLGNIVNLIAERMPEMIDMGINIVTSLVNGIVSNAPELAKAAVEIANSLVMSFLDMLPVVLDGAVEMVLGLASGIGEALPTLIPKVVEVILTMVQTLVDNIPMFVDAAIQIVVGLATGLTKALPLLVAALPGIIKGIVKAIVDSIPILVKTIPDIVTALVDAVLESIPLFIGAATILVTALVEALPEIMSQIVGAVGEIITGIVGALVENLPLIVEAGIELFTALVGALPEIIAVIVEAIPEIISGIIEAVLESLPVIVQAGIDLLVALIQALPEIIVTIVKAIPQIITGIVGALVDNIDLIILAGVQLFVALIENLPLIIIEIVKAVPEIIAGIVEAFKSSNETMAEIGLDLIKGVWQGISDAAEWLWEKVKGFFKELTDKIKKFFGISSPSTLFAGYGGYMAEGIGLGFEKTMPTISRQMQRSMQQLTSGLNTSINMDIAASLRNATASQGAMMTRGGGVNLTYAPVYQSPHALSLAEIRRQDRLNSQRLGAMLAAGG